MDQEVAKTLGELELKLQQLEHELTSIGPRDTPADTPPDNDSPQVQPSGRLVDEAMESSQADEAIADGDGFGGAPMFGGEEVPAQPAVSGQDWKVDVRETAYGEIPSEGRPEQPFGPTADGPGPLAPSFGTIADRPGPPIPPPSPTPQPPPTTPPGPPPPEHPPAPVPQPGPQPIDRTELVRFKQRLEHTMAELSDELARLLLPKPPT